MITMNMINTLARRTIARVLTIKTMMKRPIAQDMMSQWTWTMDHPIVVGGDHRMIIHMDLHLIFLPGDLLVEVHMVDHLGAGMMKVIHHRDHTIK